MDRIEQILKEREITKAAFAEMMGISRQNVNSLLKNPTRAKLEKIANVLNIPTWQLFVDPTEAHIAQNDNMVAFLHIDGKSHIPTTIDEILTILRDWKGEEFHKLCLAHLRLSYANVTELISLIDSLQSILDDYNTNH